MEDYRGSVARERDEYEELNFGPQGGDLEALLMANREFELQRSNFVSDREMIEFNAMSNPISTRKALSYLGLMLGTFGPLSILIKFIEDSGGRSGGYFFVALFLVATIVTATMGFITGSHVGGFIDSIKTYRWQSYLAVSALAGSVWGIFSGSVGGVFLLFIGAIAGGAIGGLTAGIALPIYAAAHRLLSSNGHIEQKHFFPVAFGIVFTFCAFVLGI